MTRAADGDLVTKTIADAIAAHETVRRGSVQPVVDAAAAMVEALGRGGKVLLFGNGGSAADAQHVAAELVGRFERIRRPFAAIALSADASVMTAISNDDGYERVFSRQLEALGRADDVVVAITTSGRSPNLVHALESARSLGCRTVGVTGRDGGRVAALVDIHVNVPSDSTARVQEVQRTLLHAICDLVERSFESEK
jgi:D-sedoheptulose 7-phosphate isomerase